MSLSEREAYFKLQEASGIKVGDTVKVLRAAKSHEMGWDTSWNRIEMDAAVGRTYTVTSVSAKSGFQLSSENLTRRFWFPFFVLEKVADGPDIKSVKMGDYTAYIHPDGSVCSERCVADGYYYSKDNVEGLIKSYEAYQLAD